MTSAARLALILAASFALPLPLLAVDRDAEEACRDAARALVQQETRWNKAQGSAGGSSRRELIYWLAKDGTEGVCRLDRRGRVYEVSVERFGDDEISTWPGEEDPNERYELVRCESDRRKRRECAIPRGAYVELHDQLSDTECIYGDTWGVSRGALWVDDGCRGEFAVTWEE
jgi:hypothetical protein